MGHKPRLASLVIVGLVLAGSATSAWAVPPTVAEMMNYKPMMQQDIVYSIPSRDELSLCRVEPVKSAKGQNIGWMLVDGRKQIVRRFLDASGSGRLNVWSYYKDGVEVYRETDSKGTGRGADQFRWFNEGGMKWGVDYNGDGKIDAWRMISAEEVGQEAFYALSTRDFTRLQTLFITEQEMRSLKMPQAQIDRIKAQLAKAPAKFAATAKTIPAGARFMRVEGAVPNCIPGDSIGMDGDLITFPSRTISCEAGEKSGVFIQTGEMIQVGLTWRLVDAPGEESGPGKNYDNPALTDLYSQLDKIEKEGPPIAVPQNAADVSRLLRRVAIIEKILPLIPPEDRETWIKQMLDNLATAGVKDAGAQQRLGQLRDQLTKAMPGTNLAGYAVFRHLCATYLPKIEEVGRKAGMQTELNNLQNEWLDQLTKFVQGYPNVEDTPSALDQLGTGAEFSGKDEQAKGWYRQIYTNFPNHHLAAKARGCVRRLDLIGQEMELSGNLMNMSTQLFSISQLRGKAVAVYYWTSYCATCPRDFAVLKQIHSTLNSKGLELVCVNLDDEPAEAMRFLHSNPLPAIHIYQKTGGGLNGPLATNYGINGLPTLFLVGRDGKVINRTLQANDLQEAFTKAQ